MSVRVRTDAPVLTVAAACATAIASGHTVEVPVAAWRRPALAQAIRAELDARGVTGEWSFIEPDAAEADPDAADVLGWGPVAATSSPARPRLGASITVNTDALHAGRRHAAPSPVLPAVATRGVPEGRGATSWTSPAALAALAELAELGF